MEISIRIFSFDGISPIEATLECESVTNAQLPKTNNPTSILLSLLTSERATLEVESFVEFGEKNRDHSES